jgi:hypothetical protein|tara:strand:- start:349 stop:819 length:471 start_codon:yes stop_codon:yes gene_type:complete
VKPIKACTKCGIEKEYTEEFFSKREHGKLRADCRTCYNKYYRDNNHRYLKASMVYDAKERAKKKNMDFNLVKKDIHFPEVCPVFNIKLEHGRKDWKNSPTIDRIDNNKGYVLDNCIVVSCIANTIKNSATPKQILKVGNFYKKLYKEKGIKDEPKY